MSRPFLIRAILGVLTTASTLALVAADQESFKAIFDGRTLNGWEGNEKAFRVEGEAIVAGSLRSPVAHNEFLCTKDEYGDFELRLKVKLLGKSPNAGVQLRSRRVPDHFEVRGYQADLGDGFWGALYDESRRNKVLAAPPLELIEEFVRRDDWNDYRIRCQGRHIQLWLNGQQTVDYTEPDESIEQTGVIALQIHGGEPSEAWYKDIELKRL